MTSQTIFSCTKKLVLLGFILVAFVVINNYIAISITLKDPIAPQLVSLIPIPNNASMQVDIQALVLQLTAITQELQIALNKNAPPPQKCIVTLHQILTQLNTTSGSNFLQPALSTSRKLKNSNLLVKKLNYSNVLMKKMKFDGLPIKQIKRIPGKEKSNSSVCPEVFKGRTYGAPLFVTGWVTQQCQHVPPLNEVVSVVINPIFSEQQNCSKYLQWILKGVKEHYQNLTVKIARKVNCKDVALDDYPNIHWIDVQPSEYPSSIWMQLINTITTPYVVIARNVFHFTNVSRIERQIRIIESDTQISVVGGSFRNFSGHWRVGCFQTTMMNYVLEYTEGYHNSRNECMYCDYLSGPFVAKTKIFKEIPLEDKLPEEVLFRNFFLQLKKNGYLAQNCPDVLYFADDIDRRINNVKEFWLPLMRKWQINRMLLPDGIKHTFSCKDSGVSCKARISSSKYYLLAPCCLKKYVQTLKAVHDVGLPYELNAGAILGAVKMRGGIPWDVDIDVNFKKADYANWTASRDKLLSSNVTLEDHGYYFIASTPDAKIDMDAVSQLTSAVTLPEELNDQPTLVEFDGEWVIGPGSPGLNARNRYGIEILRHAQSYIHTGHGTVYDLYETGKFLVCPQPSHHACIDHFATDGNIQFMVP